MITTIAGTGKRGSTGDGGPALLAALYWPTSLAIADDGSIYVSDQGNYIVRRISPSGTITTVAGTRLEDHEGVLDGDGGSALAAKLNDPTSLALGPGGVLYIADTKNHRIRRVGPEGTISTFAGAAVADVETGDFAGDGGPAVQALLSFPSGLSLAPDGSLLIHDAPRYLPPLKDEVIAEGIRRSARVRPRVRRVAPPLPGFDGSEIIIASEDGSEVYRFSATGQHLETRSTLTKALMYRFGYDRQGRLAAIEDGMGNTTTVERPGNNSEGVNALSILAPSGQVSHLTLDGEGYLASVQGPGKTAQKFAYATGGLLTSYTDPAGSVFQFEYDDLGRLTKDSDPAGGYKAYERVESSEGFQVSGTTTTTVENTWTVERRADGGEVRMHQCGCGELTRETVTAEGTRKVEYPDGSVAQVTSQTDTRFGAHVSLPAEQVLTTPAGRKRLTRFQRVIALAEAGDPLSLQRLTDTIRQRGAGQHAAPKGAKRALRSTNIAAP
jgi:YD repeat-containing protein